MPEQQFNYEDWESSKYTVNLDLPSTNGDSVEGSVVTRERPFILHRIKHTVVGEDGADPEQYSLDWSIQNEKRFWKGDSEPMARHYGSTHHGVWSPLSVPVPLEAKTTLYVRCVNRYNDAEPTTRKLQVVFEGLERKKGSSTQ
jgi:hypothetical protein